MTEPAHLAVQPMLHTPDLAASVAFYTGLGGEVLFRSRDNDWALLGFGATRLALLARPGGPDNPEPLELQFVASAPLDALADEQARRQPASVFRGLADEAFGRMLQLRSPEGLVVKLLELERDLIE